MTDARLGKSEVNKKEEHVTTTKKEYVDSQVATIAVQGEISNFGAGKAKN